MKNSLESNRASSEIEGINNNLRLGITKSVWGAEIENVRLQQAIDGLIKLNNRYPGTFIDVGDNLIVFPEPAIIPSPNFSNLNHGYEDLSMAFVYLSPNQAYIDAYTTDSKNIKSNHQLEQAIHYYKHELELIRNGLIDDDWGRILLGLDEVPTEVYFGSEPIPGEGLHKRKLMTPQPAIDALDNSLKAVLSSRYQRDNK